MKNEYKNYKELKYSKNSKQEIVFENLNEIEEGDNVVLKFRDGDFSAFYVLLSSCKLPFNTTLILPHFPQVIEYFEGKCIEKMLAGGKCIQFFDKNINNNDLNFDIKKPLNILPKWNIPEDSAVLFLNMNDFDKYAKNYDTYFTYPNLENEDDLPQNCYNIGNYKYISIIATSIHAEDQSCPYHIDNINKIAKELKEKYGIERVELFVSHCFIEKERFDTFVNVKGGLEGGFEISATFKHTADNFDKITTTNSTGILEVYQSDRLEVIDCVEFFDI